MVAPIRPEHADKTESVVGADPRFTITRHLVDYAYPANGNVHNPTPRYRWLLNLDGRMVDSDDRENVLVQAARQSGVAAYGGDPGRCSGCGETFKGERGLRAHQNSRFLSMGCRPNNETREG
jgi:hypothetical protein